MSFKIVSLKNSKYVELKNIIKSLESFGYEHKNHDVDSSIFHTDGFYMSTTNKVLIVYDETMLNNPKVRALLLEYLI